mmetsp:Transcript_17994/g.20382  ORF Transcript_17994/g.20382 Transcript_17994/m.20382 type:complete len:910 (-) Transcript_17994:51-2780(-)
MPLPLLRISPMLLLSFVYLSFMLFTIIVGLLSKQSSSFVIKQTTQRQRQVRIFSATTTRIMMSTTTNPPSASIEPPVARRDEDGYILAGKLNPTDYQGRYLGGGATVAIAYSKEQKSSSTPLLRQSIGNTEPLLDPPIQIKEPYGWMRDESRTNPEVLNHLDKENQYTEQLTSHLDELRSKLYEDMKAGIKETDHTVPSPRSSDGYLYYSRTFAGKSYKSFCRAPISNNDSWMDDMKLWNGNAESLVLPGEVTYLDVNLLAEGQKYCATGAIRISPPASNEDIYCGNSKIGDNRKLAYTVDFSGNEVTELYVQDLKTGEIIDHDPTIECYGAVQWGADDKTLFYITMDDQKRPYRFYKRIIGSNKADELLYQEDDELFWVHFTKSFDNKYIFVTSGSKETSETHYLDLSMDPTSTALQCVAKRRKKVLYSVSHRAGDWYITTNVDGTPNMRLMICPAVANSEQQWKDMMVVIDDNSSGSSDDGKDGQLVPLFDGGYDRSITGLTSFQSHSVATGREKGLPQVYIIAHNDDEGDNVNSFPDSSHIVKEFHQLTFDEDAYDVGLGSNLDCSAESVVVAYNSLITPLSHIKIPLNNPTDRSARTVLKEQDVPGYDKSLYACERVTVPSRECGEGGTVQIPVSIVYRKDVMEKVMKNGETVPTHLYGYGSYGACMEASFRTTRRALLDRGMVYVIAHIRGGGEMGRQWYEEPDGAKYLCKKNTFNDFVDVARWLINGTTNGDGDQNRRQITTSNQLSCEGRSAGGLLIGASMNQDPSLFKAALLGVPFVDVVPTMIDASIPLTIVEWEEWGNPNEEKYHQYMMDYSPINNVQQGATYPACLLTGGLHDPRVQYWEPTKFASEIRHQSNKEFRKGPVCLKIDMTAGHFSASDRYKYLKELAFDYAFLLDQLGLA